MDPKHKGIMPAKEIEMVSKLYKKDLQIFNGYYSTTISFGFSFRVTSMAKYNLSFDSTIFVKL